MLWGCVAANGKEIRLNIEIKNSKSLHLLRNNSN